MSEHSKILAVLMLATAACAGCANPSHGTLGANLRPIDMALSMPIDQLYTLADGADAEGQYALSIVFAYGLRGEPIDLAQSESWRSKAIALRGNIIRTMYLAGYKGRPGNVVPIATPMARFDVAQLRALESCVGDLDQPQPTDRDAADVCGGLDNLHRLSAAWGRAKAPGGGTK